ncbi:enterochelin esterase [Streptomyces sp. NBC_01381]|uniref:enterochelin esterase n=1 Tax=Streptomyces sp. NBC_01381 TaxID=2903845 RepID=UPI00224D0858|nr:enterochelin esterase [Streptomyces sp. NBC_01381]MCX4671458.1 enterochelin esterase [Streptomyces sp. NBC_01381]
MPLTAPPDGTTRRPPRIARPRPVERASSAWVDRAVERGDFWGAVRAAGGAPIVEPDPQGDADHRVVTFLWRGSEAARAVLVLPNKIVDPRDLARNLMERVPGTDIWHWSIRMRADWRATYTLCVDEGEGPQGQGEYWAWLRGRQQGDPLNSRTLARRWGGDPVSYVELPGAPRGEDWQRRDGVARGTVTTHTVRSELLGNERPVHVYEPPGGGDDLPVLVLMDGEMWQPGLDVAALLDNLIADGRIPPLVALLPDSLDSDLRWAELACNERFVGFLERELLPWAAGRLPLTDDPARTVVAGQSLGGLTAAYAAFAAPGRFGRVLAQSGSFWWPDGPDLDSSEWLTGRIAASEKLPVRFWLSAGEQEWVALPALRRLRDTLREKGYDDAVYREYNGGHDYLCWRTELADGLVGLLGAQAATATAAA